MVSPITNTGELSINMELLRWADLSNRLAAIYGPRMNPELRLLYAEDEVPFQTIADAIDVARNSPAQDRIRWISRSSWWLRRWPENVFQSRFGPSP